MEQPARGYNSRDLNGLKRDQLVALVQRQLDKWPTDRLGTFLARKTNMEKMKDALTSADSQFTTTEVLERPISPVFSNLIPPSPSSRPPESSKVAGHASQVIVQTEVQSPPLNQQPGGSPHHQNSGLSDNLSSKSLPERRSLRLLIDDTRSINEKVSQHVRVASVNPVDVESGEWQASSTEIVDMLQASIAAFKGPARIGIPDPENEGYTIFLATISGPESPQINVPSSPILVSIPPNGTLKLTVSHIGEATTPVKRTRRESLTSHDTGVSLSVKADNDSEPVASSSKKQKLVGDQLTEEELSWITEKANATPGFDEFKRNHNQRLSNFDRVRYWKFAAAFSGKYYKTLWPAGIKHSGGKMVRKNAIEAALGMGTTMLSQALNMTRILDIYSQEPHKSSEVVENIASKQSGSDSAGSQSLVDFLTQWERNHPIQTEML